MSTRLYIGNLPVGATDADVTELFTPYGVVETASVVVDRNTGRSRGFAYVELTTGAEAAIRAVHGATYRGRRMMVSEVQPRPVRPSVLMTGRPA